MQFTALYYFNHPCLLATMATRLPTTAIGRILSCLVPAAVILGGGAVVLEHCRDA